MDGADGVIEGAVTTTVGGVRVDEVAAGRARVKRMTYPAGWSWRAVDRLGLAGAHRHE
jgi:hypothetical protein